MVQLNQLKFQKLLKEIENIEINPSMIQPTKEIKSIRNI